MRSAIFGIACFLAVTAAAFGEAGAAETPMLASKLVWRNIGPFVGGRVVAVAGAPGRTNTFYMGAVDGGVWKSTDYGVQWTNITDGTLPSASNSIGSIAVAPSDQRVLYVGTGESDIRGDIVTGNGVYRSTDAGKTWRAAGLENTHTLGALVVDPRNADVVYAASMGHVFASNADRGVFKSTDGGRTWKSSLFVDDKTGAIALVMDPKHPDTLYAAMWQAYRTPWTLQDGGLGSGLFKTDDGGAHWSKISGNPGFATGTFGRIGVTVSGADPRVVYAIVQAKDGGVFRSSNGGATWTRVNDDWKLRQRAFYYMTIYADPTDANTVYVPEVDALFVSHDGGKIWTKLRTPHGDNHVLWIDPSDPRILLEGNDGGATVSTDAGETWSGEHTQPTGQFYHVSIDDRFPFHVYGAQQDEASVEGPNTSPGGSIGEGDWHDVAYGESTFVAPEPGDPDITFGSGYFSIFLRYDEATGEYRSVSAWPDYREGASSDELKYRLGWTHPIIFSPVNPSQLLVGSQFVLESDDHGLTWREISPDLTRNDPTSEAPTGGPVDLDQTSAEVFPDVSALAVSPLDGDLIWAGSADGLVHVTTDHGQHWQTVTPPTLPQWAEITSIEPSHAAKGTAYLSASRYMWDDFHPYVYETTDFGQHWTQVVAGLPADEYVFAVRQDPADADLLLAGTKTTVYASFDGGAEWQPLGLNLPHVQVRDVAIDSRQGCVAIATHGRAFWVLDDLTVLEQMTKGGVTAETAPQLLAPQTAWLSHAFGASAFPRAAAGTDAQFGATVFFALPAGYDGSTAATVSFTDPSGSVLRTFRLHLKSKKPAPDQKTKDQWMPAQAKAYALDQLTSASPGMNSLQWDLRTEDATEVRGFWVPVPAGGLPDDVIGPTVAPGTYGVVLQYGGATQKQTFTVALDPRIQVPADALAARFDLQMRINRSLDRLDTALNEALDARDALSGAVDARRLTSAQAGAALDALNRDIGDLVQLDLHSSEGPLMHEIKIRSRLAYLSSDIDLAYDRPTQAEYAVFQELDGIATSGEAKLAADIAAVKRLAP